MSIIILTQTKTCRKSNWSYSSSSPSAATSSTNRKTTTIELHQKGMLNFKKFLKENLLKLIKF